MVSNWLLNVFAEARRRRVFGVLALYIVGAWVVLQVAATLFPGWRIPDEAIRFVWLGAVLLFPGALVFGWKYDVSAQGIRRTPPANSEVVGLPLNRADHWILAVIALLSVGVCFGVIREIAAMHVDSPQVQVANEIPANSIAVLPFVNMSDDKDNEYFSDGITEQLLNELAGIPDLHVAARTSAFYYKDKNEKMQTVGEQLGVRTVLEGSVRKAGDTVRITAQLINASDGYHLWSDTYDRKIDDIFAVQDEIAAAIVDTLRIELMIKDQERIDRSITKSVEAFDIYLRAMARRNTLTGDSLVRSNEMFADAIEIDPEFAHAYVALAYGYILESFSGSMTIDDANAEAALLLEKALALRPDLAEAHASMGLLKARLERYGESDEHFATALAINPNDFGSLLNYGLTLVWQSRLKEASAAYLKAQSLDPLNADLNFNLGALLMLMGEVDSGLGFMQKSLQIKPDMYMVRGAITHWLGTYGRLDEAIANGRATLADYPENTPNTGALVQAYIWLGLIDEAKSLVESSRAAFPDDENIKKAEINVMLSTGDRAAFIELADREFHALDLNVGDPLDFRSRARAYYYAWASLMQGEYQRAADYFFWVAGGEEGIASKTYDDMYMLKMLALSYRKLDRFEESDALLDRCLDLVAGARDRGWATPTLFVRLAEIHAIRGDVENAVSNLEIALDKGWRDLNMIEYGVFWQGLQDNPEINRIKVRILNDLEDQKLRLENSMRASLRATLGDPNARVSRSVFF